MKKAILGLCSALILMGGVYVNSYAVNQVNPHLCYLKAKELKTHGFKQGMVLNGEGLRALFKKINIVPNDLNQFVPNENYQVYFRCRNEKSSANAAIIARSVLLLPAGTEVPEDALQIITKIIKVKWSFTG